jgi:hypothetical protein
MVRWRGGHVEGAPALASWVPAGWYPDPLGLGAARYWDGSGWSRSYRDAPPPLPVPLDPAPTREGAPDTPPRMRPAAPAAAAAATAGEDPTRVFGAGAGSRVSQLSRNRLLAIGAGILVAGFVVGIAAGSGGNDTTTTVTRAQAPAAAVASTPTPTRTVVRVHIHTHTVTHTVTRTVSQPVAAPSGPEGGDGEEGEEDEVGSYSHAGDAKFCEEHECIGDFENEPGEVVECSDGSYSHSGGISGACSDHGGEA